MTSGCKIVWAIDVFDKAVFDETAAAAVTALDDQIHPEIFPVHVLTHAEDNLPPEADFEVETLKLEKYKTAAVSAARSLIDPLNLKQVHEPKVLIEPFASMKRCAKSLCEYARGVDASFVLATTHARHGASRLFYGSFAESLVNCSKIPVMTIGPHRDRRIKRIVLPIDFGRMSYAVFQSTLQLAKLFDAELILYHFYNRAAFVPVFGDGIVPMTYQGIEDLDDQRVERQHFSNLLKDWCKEAKSVGIKAHYFIEDRRSGGLAGSILDFAKLVNASCIALCAEQGRLASMFFGSAIHEVVRDAQCPVWVVKAEALEARLQNDFKMVS